MRKSLASTIAFLTAITLVSGCSGKAGAPTTPQVAVDQTAQGLETQSEQVAQSSFTSLYTFKGIPDAATPVSDLVPFNGLLYGTSVSGGICAPCTWPQEAGGFGTVFSINPSGSEQIVYRFRKGQESPDTGLLPMNGKLYGTTEYEDIRFSGFYGGTVFELSTAGVERTLYTFGYDPQTTPERFGSGYPFGTLVSVNGNLYGTTANGSRITANDNGTVFKVNPSGSGHTLYHFRGGSDGSNPGAGLLYSNGMFYGTTMSGGTNNNGTVFSISLSGSERILYRFKGGSDGSGPAAALISLNGELYGTTERGGEQNDGTVFAITPSGSERVVYCFKGGSDGAFPKAKLTALKGNLYGTTKSGGSSNNGTIFAVSPSGNETILHRFKGGSDGLNPEAGVVEWNGQLYGTTSGGDVGFGTVFRVSPIKSPTL